MVHGTVARGFESVRAGFEEGQLPDSGGAQLCVYHKGQKVVDLWTGRDKTADRPYTDNTLTVCFSVSKGATATMAHMLADRGQLDYDAPVARYWPEFAQNGKDKITLSHVLSHTAGLSGFEPDSGVVAKDMVDWQKCTTALAAMAPLWEPGTAMSYHAVTYGYLVGEVIRRITGKMPGTFFAEEVVSPLGLELWIGLPETQEPRVAAFYTDRSGFNPDQIRAFMQGMGIDLTTRLGATMIKGMTDLAGLGVLNTREGHAADIPAANMIGTAAALARMYAATIGEIDGVRLFGDRTMRRAMVPLTSGLKAPGDFAKMPAPSPHHYGLGYQLTRDFAPMLGEGSFGHDGAGGRIGFAHPASGTAVGYVGNNMMWDAMSGPDARWMPWTAALREVLKV